MTTKSAKYLFIYGSLFFFIIFLGLTYDTMKKVDERTPPITDKIDAGKKVWHKYDCIGCHTILGNGSYFAPDMTKVIERKPKAYLKKFLMDPKSVKANATMPKLGISSEEADSLIAFLEWISKVDTNGWPPKPLLASVVGAGIKILTEGQKVFQSQGCINCHIINGVGGTSGPELTKIGAKRDKNWLYEFIKNPSSKNPNSAMPAFDNLKEEELNQLVEYLSSLK
jgi:nitric oxide reductase subunit C